MNDQVEIYDENAEVAFLAACLNPPDSETVMSDALSAGVTADSFYLARHRAIFFGLTKLLNDGQPLDDLALGTWLNGRTTDDLTPIGIRVAKKPLLEFCGGFSAITEIANQVEVTAHSKHWTQVLLQKSKLRRFIQLCQTAAKSCAENQDELNAIVGGLQNDLLDLNAERESSLVSASDFVQEAWDEMEAARLGESRVTMGATGLIDLDKILNGFKPGRLYTIAARPGVGKSALAGQILMHTNLKLGIPVIVFTLEMGPSEWGARMICASAKINYQRYVDGFVQGGIYERVQKTRDELKKAGVTIEKKTGHDIQAIRSVVRNWKARFCEDGKGLVIIDYLQLVRGSAKASSREQEVSDVARGSKLLAREMELPVIALSQVSREVEKRKDGRLILSDLRESGAIEQDSDVVIFLNPKEDEYAAQGQTILADVAKHRGGPLQAVPVTFIPDFTLFANYAKA